MSLHPNLLSTPVNAGITGFESPASDYLPKPLRIDDVLVAHPSSSAIIRVTGSLPQQGIFAGDLLLVDQAETPVLGDICLIEEHGESTLAVFERNLEQSEFLVVLGVVRASFRRHRPLSNDLPDNASYAELPYSLHELIIPQSHTSFLAYANGKSMVCAGIHDGDLLIAQREIRPENMDVIVATYRNDLVCKRLDIKRKRLLSDNPLHPAFPIRPTDNFRVEAVIVTSIRLFRSLLK